MISEFTVAWVTSESKFAMELAKEWIESDVERFAAAGWATYSSHAAITEDKDLDISLYKSLLDRVEKRIHSAQNRERHVMNAFVIAIGGSIPELTERAFEVGHSIGKIEVDMGGTSCKVPSAPIYIQKIIDRGSLGKKRKSPRC